MNSHLSYLSHKKCVISGYLIFSFLFNWQVTSQNFFRLRNIILLVWGSLYLLRFLRYLCTNIGRRGSLSCNRIYQVVRVTKIWKVIWRVKLTPLFFVQSIGINHRLFILVKHMCLCKFHSPQKVILTLFMFFLLLTHIKVVCMAVNNERIAKQPLLFHHIELNAAF